MRETVPRDTPAIRASLMPSPAASNPCTSQTLAWLSIPLFLQARAVKNHPAFSKPPAGKSTRLLSSPLSRAASSPFTPFPRSHPSHVHTLPTFTPSSRSHPSHVHALLPFTPFSRSHPSPVLTLPAFTPFLRSHPSHVLTLPTFTPFPRSHPSHLSPFPPFTLPTFHPSHLSPLTPAPPSCISPPPW